MKNGEMVVDKVKMRRRELEGKNDGRGIKRRKHKECGYCGRENISKEGRKGSDVGEGRGI